ncbi:hypothetical protein KDM41_06620 [bacterium]|nr:hypothetical protein [bacterium]
MQKRTKILLILSVLPALLLAGCSLDDPATPADLNGPGLEDAGARYAAIGNSLTAGYMDGGLMQAGQAGSYPRLIAQQLGLDDTSFTQPWIKAPGIGAVNTTTGEVDGVYYFNGAGLARLGSTPALDVQSTLLLAGTQPVAYHNLGVPGALLTDGRNAYSAATSFGASLTPPSPNPFFDFINRAALFGNTEVTLAAGPPAVTTQSTSMHYKAIAKGGALTTVWLGNNDVLGAATGGNPTAANITDPTAFGVEYNTMLQTLAGGLLKRNGFPATIITANIPSVTSAPFFIPTATFETAIGGAWPWGFEESNVDYVLFPTLSWVADAGNLGSPIPSTATLTTTEVTTVETAIATFNGIILNATTTLAATEAVPGSGIPLARAAMVDANDLLAGLAAAQKTHFLLLVGGGMPPATAAATTAFSLDGIHPNNVGYGIVANAFIAQLNALEGTSVPDVDLAGLSWDPTYGVPLTAPTKTDRPYRMTPEDAAGLTAVWR